LGIQHATPNNKESYLAQCQSLDSLLDCAIVVFPAIWEDDSRIKTPAILKVLSLYFELTQEVAPRYT
jgi:hypothetical protein